MLGELLVLVVLVLLAGGLGLWLGIVILAPRLARRFDRPNEEPDDRPA